MFSVGVTRSVEVDMVGYSQFPAHVICKGYVQGISNTEDRRDAGVKGY